jgi:ketosteroid isomerase-like protein
LALARPAPAYDFPIVEEPEGGMAASIRTFALVGALALALLPALASAQSATRITEPQVRALVERVTAAANRRDVQAVVQTMADDAVVTIDFRGPDGKRQRMKMNRAQYETHSVNAMRTFQKYSYKRETSEINIAPDGQTATVKGRAREVAELQGNTMVAATEDTTTLALRDGRLLVTAIHGVMR